MRPATSQLSHLRHGPYQILTCQGQLIELRRNPYPTVVLCGTAEELSNVIRYVARAVEASRVWMSSQGEADVMLSFSDKATNVRLRARYRDSFTSNPGSKPIT
jgi:hypothetical protein